MNPIRTRILRSIFALGCAAGLSACASVDRADINLETASRAAPVATSLQTATRDIADTTALPDLNIVQINVEVPQDLRVSEANRYYPGSDIVWREDPIGDRHQQVQKIVYDAMAQGVINMQGNYNAILDIKVTKFHALTEKARYTVGGVHAIQFHLRVRDAATGAVIMPARHVKADFEALGGRAAVNAEARGLTQKVRITNQLAHVVQRELTNPEGFAEFRTGLMGAINQL